ncbi:hypothetical protein [Saccharibacillus qingshengii]|uniref:hypothetical protein n=1 Tax=Saccharibacillus qingshengii TaxID=1763540 RepID=UPI00155333F3|nr:hypothetical protein [Saccharibacillus qingshengii]
MYAVSAAIVFLPGQRPAHIRQSLLRMAGFILAAAVILPLLPSASAVYAAVFVCFAAYALAEGIVRTRGKRTAA